MKAVVIGAGIGGLSAAAFLAQRGVHTVVLEKNAFVGGRTRELSAEGSAGLYRFDAGPLWALMPKEHDAWFENFGLHRRDFYDIARIHTPSKYFFHEGIIDIPADKEGAARAFDSVEPGAGGRLQELLYELARNHELFISLMRTSAHTLKAKLAAMRAKAAFLGASAESFRARVKKVAADHRLQKILEFPALFFGTAPHKLPALYAALTDFMTGFWQPVGGFARVAEAMASVAQNLGARIVLGAEVQSVSWKDNRTLSGVEASDAFYDADIIVANADRHFVDGLLIRENRRDFTARQWGGFPRSHSALCLCLGVKHPLPAFAPHTFFFDGAWDEHLAALAEKRWPHKPLFYVRKSSASEMCPEGHSALCAIAPVPSGGIDSKNERAALIAKMMERMDAFVENGPLSKYVEAETVVGPGDFERDFNAYKGSAFGMSLEFSQAGFRRMQNKAKKIANLYYAGQYTVPGTGATMAMISGELAAKRATDDFKL